MDRMAGLSDHAARAAEMVSGAQHRFPAQSYSNRKSGRGARDTLTQYLLPLVYETIVSVDPGQRSAVGSEQMHAGLLYEAEEDRSGVGFAAGIRRT
jgi:hypothetical protein